MWIALRPHRLLAPDRRGFTIVELLIVIVVIGILAAIVIVTYNGIQQKAWNVARMSELREWDTSFSLYKAVNSTYPPSPNLDAQDYYCLGRNFPSNACWNPYDYLIAGQTNQPIAYADNGILTAIESVSSLPNGPRWGIGGGPNQTMGDGVGPIVEYHSGVAYSVWNFFYVPCPSSTDLIWTDGYGARCEIKLQ